MRKTEKNNCKPEIKAMANVTVDFETNVKLCDQNPVGDKIAL